MSFVYIFVIGLFPDNQNLSFVYYTFISLIYFFSILTIKDKSNHYFYVPVIMIILTWVTEFLNFPLLSRITGIISTFFFFIIIILLVIRVARSKTVGVLEFLESVNVYLLLGIAGSILFGMIYSTNHDAYNPKGEILKNQADFIYYSFVTMTTLGYGDITPNDSLARSLSIFFSVAGQLYLTMIIAMLVGKYLSEQTEK
ncbi:MAG: hypothetical protein GXO86_14180 [Chlorobi bacterium]|nr:hypothetical protein [Chlorobiota bacterium]